MSGDPENKSPEDESGDHPLEGEFSGNLRGGTFRFRVPASWISTAAPAMLVLAYVFGVALAILIVCFGVSLIVK